MPAIPSIACTSAEWSRSEPPCAATAENICCAIAVFGSAIAISRAEFSARLRSFWCHRARNPGANVRARFDVQSAKRPGCFRPGRDRGNRGSLARGRAATRQSLALDPRLADAQDDLTIALVRQGKTAEAVRHLTGILQRDARRPGAFRVANLLVAQDDLRRQCSTIPRPCDCNRVTSPRFRISGRPCSRWGTSMGDRLLQRNAGWIPAMRRPGRIWNGQEKNALIPGH